MAYSVSIVSFEQVNTGCVQISVPDIQKQIPLNIA